MSDKSGACWFCSQWAEYPYVKHFKDTDDKWQVVCQDCMRAIRAVIGTPWDRTPEEQLKKEIGEYFEKAERMKALEELKDCGTPEVPSNLGGETAERYLEISEMLKEAMFKSKLWPLTEDDKKLLNHPVPPSIKELFSPKKVSEMIDKAHDIPGLMGGKSVEQQIREEIVKAEIDRERENLIEKCAEEVHKAYCYEYLRTNHREYWTNGDYSKLDESTKDIDRATVRAVLKTVEENN